LPEKQRTRPATRPTLTGERVVLRPMRPDDVQRLSEILAEPGVARWWGMHDPKTTAAELLDESEQVAYVIEVESAAVGCILFYEEDDPDYRHASIDLFLDGAHQGQGLGRDAVRTLARHLFDERGHHRLTIDPSAANERAIRAYEGLGFRRVGVMRRYERGPDGMWRDGLLLDLLRDELT
jgi:aminoglycoside 6'-N-acetyltransferase